MKRFFDNGVTVSVGILMGAHNRLVDDLNVTGYQHIDAVGIITDAVLQISI